MMKHFNEVENSPEMPSKGIEILVQFVSVDTDNSMHGRRPLYARMRMRIILQN